jgi:uncharacterized integral membrane protein
LPAWVKQLAPPEVKDEFELEEEPAAGEKEELQDTQLPAEMLAFLSSAIDSDEDIELTREMIDEYLPEAKARQPIAEQEEPQTVALESGSERLQEIGPAVGAEAEESEEADSAPVTDSAAGEARQWPVMSDNMRWLLIFVAVVVLLVLILVLMFIAWNPLELGAGRADFRWGFNARLISPALVTFLSLP